MDKNQPAPSWGRNARYPRDGERLGPAWELLWRYLGGIGVWQTAAQLHPVVAELITEKTVSSLLANAAGHGHLQRRVQLIDHRHRAQYRRP